MSKVNCPCGWQISDVGYPSGERGYLTTQRQFDLYDDDTLSDVIQTEGRDMWECSQCGRLAFEMPGRTLQWYEPVGGKQISLCYEADGDCDDAKTR